MQTAVVTGAGRGMGRAIAERLAAHGLSVLATDVDAAAAQETASKLGSGAWSAALDVRDPGACRAVAGEAAAKAPLTVWVNNAGILRTEHAWEHPDADVALMVDVNLRGVINGSRAAIGAMAGPGRILNMASLSAFGPVQGLAIYTSTKWAVLGFSLSLEGDMRDAGRPIEIRTYCPDVVDTTMVHDIANRPEAAIEFSGSRWLSVDEAADAAVDLLYGKRLFAATPRGRMWLASVGRVAPRVGMALLPLIKKAGERNRRKWQAGDW
ncbi:MAG: SDR family oxidoreductase [Thermoleophilaceae bacterium]|nr:SDR family oxidoreductase [Thermoleophilaceae bacterium]